MILKHDIHPQFFCVMHSLYNRSSVQGKNKIQIKM